MGATVAATRYTIFVGGCKGATNGAAPPRPKTRAQPQQRPTGHATRSARTSWMRTTPQRSEGASRPTPSETTRAPRVINPVMPWRRTASRGPTAAPHSPGGDGRLEDDDQGRQCLPLRVTHAVGTTRPVGSLLVRRSGLGGCQQRAGWSSRSALVGCPRSWPL